MEFVLSAIIVIFSSLVGLVVVRQIVFTGYFMLRSDVSKHWPEPDDWPSVTVLIAAHNEEQVIDGCLTAMRQLDYPEDKLSIVVVNDRSTDRTGEIVDRHVSEDARISAVHRVEGMRPGKPAAVKGVIDGMTTDVFVIFDADYLPMPRLLRQLVAPFQDPRVGATMGRVIPYNTDKNLLTRLIDLERRAGYGVDQQVRSLWGLLPQFGGTAGGVRLSALRRAGGWRDDTLTEDTDLTYRLFLNNFDVVYLPDAVCYEESPEDWQVRFRQVRRWAYGHNECLLRYFLPVLVASNRPLLARLDAALVLLFYAIPFFAVMTLIIFLTSPFLWAQYGSLPLGVPIMLAFVGFGNFAPYFQIAAACVHDRQVHVFRAAPLIFFSSFISMMASTSAIFMLLRDWALRRRPVWDKTARYRLGTWARNG